MAQTVAAADHMGQVSLSSTISRFLVLAMALLVPLAINPWSFQPYTLIKVMIFAALLLTAAFFWLIEAAVRGVLTVRFSRLHLFILTYLLTAVAATFFSVSRTTSFFGWFMRYDGLLALLGYALLFTLVYQLFSRQKQALDYLSILFIASILVCVYALFEFFGYSLFPELAIDSSRLAALWGNPGFLGGFLTLTIPVSLALVLDVKDRATEAVLAAANLVLALPVLYLSHTKSAWLGVGIGLLILLLVKWRKLNLRLLMVSLIAIALFSAILIIAGLSADKDVGRRSANVNKINLNESGRLFYWRVALSSLGKKPVLGYGLDTFNYAYRLNRPADWRLYDTEGKPVDKAHNQLLQTASNMGVLGLAAYLALLIALVGGLLKGARRASGEKNTLIWGLTASIVAYLIFTQAYFSTVVLSPFFWSLAAIGMALSENSYRSVSIKLPVAFRVSVAPLLMAVVVAGIFVCVRVQQADYHFERGFVAADSGNWAQVVLENKSAVALNSSEVRYQLYLGLSQLKYAAKHRSLGDFQIAAQTYQRLIKTDPAYADAYAGLGDVYLAENQLLHKKTLPLALANFKRADRLAKYSPSVKSKLARTLTLMKNRSNNEI